MIGRKTPGVLGLAAWCLAGPSCSLVFDTSRLQEQSGSESTGSASTNSSGAGGARTGGGGAGSGTGAGSAAGGNAACGNGVIEGAEECDDGNEVADDDCTACAVACDGPNEIKEPTTFHCYLFVPDSDLRFADARQFCKEWSRTADLASVTTAEEFGFITVTNSIENHTWTGATDLVEEGVYQWVSGEPWSYANWQAGYPNDPDGSLDCVDFGIQGFQWQNAPCSSTRRVLCERAPAGTPAN